MSIINNDKLKIKKIIINFLIYTEDNLKDGVIAIEKILKQMFQCIDIEWVIVDNSNICTESKIDNKFIIHGNNDFFEFSGWDKGFQYAKTHLDLNENTLFLYANDTFYRRNYADGENFLDFFDHSILQGKDVLNSAIGYLDDFPRDVILNGIIYKQWIRSNIFFLPYSVAEHLFPLTFPFDENKIFSDKDDEFWADSDLISPNWKVYINSWLFGLQDSKYPEYRLTWLKSEPLTPQNKEFFKRKAMTILSEHYLTARLFRDQIPIIDTNIFQKDPNRHIKAYYKGPTA